MVAPYEAHHWCWNLGEVVKMSVRTQTSCSADSFSTLGVGAFWTWGLTPLRDRHMSAVLRQSAFSPLRGTVFTAGMFVQRLKPPRKFVWIIRTCCWANAVVGESPQTCVWRAPNLQNRTYGDSLIFSWKLNNVAWGVGAGTLQGVVGVTAPTEDNSWGATVYFCSPFICVLEGGVGILWHLEIWDEKKIGQNTYILASQRYLPPLKNCTNVKCHDQMLLLLHKCENVVVLSSA